MLLSPPNLRTRLIAISKEAATKLLHGQRLVLLKQQMGKLSENGLE